MLNTITFFQNSKELDKFSTELELELAKIKMINSNLNSIKKSTEFAALLLTLTEKPIFFHGLFGMDFKFGMLTLDSQGKVNQVFLLWLLLRLNQPTITGIFRNGVSYTVKREHAT